MPSTDLIQPGRFDRHLVAARVAAVPTDPVAGVRKLRIAQLASLCHSLTSVLRAA